MVFDISGAIEPLGLRKDRNQGTSGASVAKIYKPFH